VVGVLAAASACAPPDRAAAESAALSTAAAAAALTAGGGTLAGVVYAGPAPLPATRIEALSPGTAAVLAAGSTDPAGGFALALAAGSYDLRLTPPASSGLAAQLVAGVTVPPEGASHDFVLVAPGRRLSGVLRGRDGLPVPGVGVFVEDPFTGEFLGNATTDAAGAYALFVPPGEYVLATGSSAPGGRDAPVPTPNLVWSLNRSGLTVTGDTVFDIALPVVRVSGQVVDADGVPVAGAQVAGASFFSQPSDSLNAQSVAVTDSAGRYDFFLLAPGTLRLTALPPAGSPLSGHTDDGLSLTGDLVHDIALAVPSSHLAGVARGLDGVPVAGVQVGAGDLFSGQPGAAAVTDATGAYRLSLADGNGYSISFGSSVAIAGAPAIWRITRDGLVVAGDTLYDQDLQFVRVAGTVTDPDGLPVAGAAIKAVSSFSTSAASAFAHDAAVSGADGRYQVVLIAGSATLAVSPPAGSPLAIHVEGGRPLAGDLTLDFRLGAGHRASGRVMLADGTPIAGATVSVTASTLGQDTVASVVTDAAGAYAFALESERYQLTATLKDAGKDTPSTLPRAWSVSSEFFNLNSDVVLDFPLAPVRLAGAILRSSGAGVAGVGVGADSNGAAPPLSWFSSAGTGATAADGRFAVSLLPDSARIGYVPPAGSGFPETHLTGIALATDREQTVIWVDPVVTPPPPETAASALRDLATALSAVPRLGPALAAIARGAEAAVASGEAALAAGNPRRARADLCAARLELDGLARLLTATPARLLDPARAGALIADARHAQSLIATRMSQAGLRACN